MIKDIILLLVNKVAAKPVIDTSESNLLHCVWDYMYLPCCSSTSISSIHISSNCSFTDCWMEAVHFSQLFLLLLV